MGPLAGEEGATIGAAQGISGDGSMLTTEAEETEIVDGWCMEVGIAGIAHGMVALLVGHEPDDVTAFFQSVTLFACAIFWGNDMWHGRFFSFPSFAHGV